MTTRTNSAPGQGVMALKQVRELAGADPRFAEALAHAHSPPGGG